MSKVLRLAILAALLLTLGSVGLASAQGGVTYASSFQVQNLDASNPAVVVLDYYNQSNGLLQVSVPYTISASSSRTFFATDVAAGFNGSLVISSDRDIRAINNITGSGPGTYLDSTNGFQAGSPTVNLPLVMCNNSGFDTWFNVQNAGSQVANVHIDYIPGSDGATGKSEDTTINPGAAKTFNQAVGSSTVNCSTLAAAPRNRFIGSARITSSNNQPLAAVVMQVNTTSFKVLMGYAGFASGMTNVALPLIMANNSGFYTSYQVQNVSTTATANVTVHYGPNISSGTFAPVDETFQLTPGTARTVFQSSTTANNGSSNNWGTSGRYIGSATVSTVGGSIVAIVNQQAASPTALASTYDGFDPTTATSKISAPLIMANNSGYYTTMQIQNTATSGTATVDVVYGPNISGAFHAQPEHFTLNAGSSKTIFQASAPPLNGSVNTWPTGSSKYIGSATITSTGGNIVAIINQQAPTRPGDQLATNAGFNLP